MSVRFHQELSLLLESKSVILLRFEQKVSLCMGLFL